MNSAARVASGVMDGVKSVHHPSEQISVYMRGIRALVVLSESEQSSDGLAKQLDRFDRCIRAAQQPIVRREDFEALCQEQFRDEPRHVQEAIMQGDVQAVCAFFFGMVRESG